MSNERQVIYSHWRQGGWFIAALLLALASSVLPALMISGPVSSRTIGSAFDPTTTGVALHRRAKSRLDIVLTISRPDRDEGRAGGAPSLLLPIAPEEISQGATPLPAIDPAAPPARREALRRVTRAQPRAPPLPSA